MHYAARRCVIRALLHAAVTLEAEASPSKAVGKTMTGQEAFEMFLDAAKMVWRHSKLLSQITFHYEVKAMLDRDVRAQLQWRKPTSEDARPRAEEDHLLRAAKEYWLLISERLLSEPRDVVRQVMIHEALHIGYSSHKEGFRRMAIKYGGTLTEKSTGKDKPFEVQRKNGSRYKTIKTFETERDAKHFIETERKASPDSDYRMIF